MITLTERAATKIRSLTQAADKPDACLRLFVTNGGCSGMEYGMKVEVPTSSDVSLESSGLRFAVDADSLPFLKGSEIDFDDGLAGKGFEIRNPNAKATCGCGKSFN